MAIYNPKSLKAEEFINHEEILDTIRYAEENKHNLTLIDGQKCRRHPDPLCRTLPPGGIGAAGLRHSGKGCRDVRAG